MKIGIFGGSFNPPHKGHRKALEAFIKTLSLDKVYVIPTFLSPHKSAPALTASFEDRMKMSALAFSDTEGAEVIISDLERRIFDITGEKSYTYLTIEKIKKESSKLFLFVGSDMFFTLDSWARADYVFENVTVAVMSREGDENKVAEYKLKYEKERGAKIALLDAKPLEISSTEMRGSADATKKMADERVSEYIQIHKLYKERPTREEIVALVEETLPKKRFLHTLAVEEEALFLAKSLCPEFTDEISRGALLHDVTKYLSEDEQIKAIKNVTNDDLSSPQTLHALSGAVFAEKELFESGDVCRMIKSHTTGDADMTLFEMLVFVSDYVEKTRIHTPCQTERERLHRELEEAKDRKERYSALKRSVIRILEGTVNYLESKNSFIHSRTLSALEAMKSQEE